MSQTIVYTDLPMSAPCVEVSKHSPKLTNDVTAADEKIDLKIGKDIIVIHMCYIFN